MKLAARVSLAASLALLALPAKQAVAQTNIDYFAQFSPTTTVQYLPFYVSVGGTFVMQSSGLNNVDPWFLLFSGYSYNGAGLGSLLASDDESAPAQAGWNSCLGAGGTCHPLISLPLTPGGYTLTMSVAILSEAEARAGAASWDEYQGQYNGPFCDDDADWSDCNFDVSLTSRDGSVTEVVPEPATMTLLATGLAGLTAMRRRKKA